jgi:hypothetical protein
MIKATTSAGRPQSPYQPTLTATVLHEAIRTTVRAADDVLADATAPDGIRDDAACLRGLLERFATMIESQIVE